MKKTTSDSYRRRLSRVIDHIHDNIKSELDVNTLAEIAFMSPYHFHRIYRELMLETVNATVRRLRLQKAAIDLIRTDQSIQTIAHEVSYSSSEAFSRAFSKQFDMSPIEYRNTKQKDSKFDEPFITMLPTDKKRYERMFNVEELELDEIHLAGYSHKGDYMKNASAFDKLIMNAASQNLLNEYSRIFGIYYDDPKSVDEDQLRSMACLSVDKSQTVENDMQRFVIPAGKYVSILFKGPYPELERPYNWLFGEWIPNNNLQAADFPPFEEYLNNPKETPPNELLTRIYCHLA